MHGIETHLLGLQLPAQQTRIGHREFVLHTGAQEIGEALVDDGFFRLGVGIPVNDLMAETLTAPAHGVADASGTDTNTGGSHPPGGDPGGLGPRNFIHLASLGYGLSECTESSTADVMNSGHKLYCAPKITTRCKECSCA